jgi:4-carboxymuconolactone decarboxylase
MPRIPDLKPDEMSAEQRRLAEEIGATRGGVVRGPFAIWLRNPALVDLANKFGSFLRTGTSVPRRLSELAILVTARHWTAQYEWHAHENQAREAGITDGVIEAVRGRRRPTFAKQDEAVVYDLVHELYEKRAVSDQTYKRAIDTLGQLMTIELVTIASFYTMVALVLVAFEAPLPAGTKPPLPA